jgi:hypothetical protein
MGFQIDVDTLPNIDTMMTNFNQIVIRNGTINKYFFCFDLPVAQLSVDAKPLVNNCLVTRPVKSKIGSEGGGGGLTWNLLEEFKRKRDLNST